jgi:hypothetical protein
LPESASKGTGKHELSSEDHFIFEKRKNVKIKGIPFFTNFLKKFNKKADMIKKISIEPAREDEPWEPTMSFFWN